MDADDCAGELIEARQYVLEEVAADRDLTRLPRLVPHIIVRAEEDRLPSRGRGVSPRGACGRRGWH